jgi:hypothetical protein
MLLHLCAKGRNMAIAMRLTGIVDHAMPSRAEDGVRHIGEILLEVLAEHHLNEVKPRRSTATRSARRRRIVEWPIAEVLEQGRGGLRGAQPWRATLAPLSRQGNPT